MTDDIVDAYFIPPKPAILVKVQDALSEDEPDLLKVSALISDDVGLSSAVLCQINSPFYGMQRKISDIKQAAMMLGLEKIHNLIAGYFLKKGFTQKSCISLERFWDEASDIANTMVYIGNNLEILDLNGKHCKGQIPLECLYSLGLFHNCGIPAIAQKHSDYKKLLMKADLNNLSSIQLEDEQYGTGHAIVGFYICSSWHLPKNICQIVLRHHDLTFLDNKVTQVDAIFYCVLKMAENIVYRFNQNQESPDWAILKNNVYDILQMDEVSFRDLYDDIICLLD